MVKLIQTLTSKPKKPQHLYTCNMNIVNIAILVLHMKGLSKQEIKVIAELEFYQRYYFTKDDIRHHFGNPREIRDFIYHLKKKGRIVRINRRKYYLVPIKAKSGKWSDNPFVIADEICDGKDYFIGGWAAASYWHLTEQIPMRIDVYTTRRQGKARILNTNFVFHRTSRKMTAKAVTQKIGNNNFEIAPKSMMAEWMKSRK